MKSQRETRHSHPPVKTCNMHSESEPHLPFKLFTDVLETAQSVCSVSPAGGWREKLPSERWVLIRPFKKLHFWFLNRFVYFDTGLYNKSNH